MEETETNHPQELGKVGKSRQRMFTVVHDIIAPYQVKPSISLHTPTAMTSKHYCMFLVPLPLIYRFTVAKMGVVGEVF